MYYKTNSHLTNQQNYPWVILTSCLLFLFSTGFHKRFIMIVVTEAWIFNGPIQHLLATVFVAMVIGISYLFVKKVQDLEIQLVVLKEKNSVLKTESENLKRKVELLEISYKQFVDRSKENKIEDAKQGTMNNRRI